MCCLHIKPFFLPNYLTLLEPQSHMWGQTTEISRSLSPTPDCGSKGVNTLGHPIFVLMPDPTPIEILISTFCGNRQTDVRQKKTARMNGCSRKMPTYRVREIVWSQAARPKKKKTQLKQCVADVPGTRTDQKIRTKNSRQVSHPRRDRWLVR